MIKTTVIIFLFIIFPAVYNIFQSFLTAHFTL